jgi:predicted dinucleotide-binding enzyme
MKNRILSGTRVIYAFQNIDGTSVTRHSGTGTVIRNDVIIGTDDGYAIKQDSDGEVSYVRDWGVKVVA